MNKSLIQQVLKGQLPSDSSTACLALVWVLSGNAKGPRGIHWVALHNGDLVEQRAQGLRGAQPCQTGTDDNRPQFGVACDSSCF